MTHAGHRAYKKVDQKNRPCDLNIFVWHYTEKCVLGFTLLRNQFAALQARICAECCHVKRINQSNMEILRNNRLINDIVNVSC